MLFSALFHAGWLVTLFLEVGNDGARNYKQIFEEMQKVHPVVLRYCGPERKKRTGSRVWRHNRLPCGSILIFPMPI